jgi:hypothetical protein
VVRPLGGGDRILLALADSGRHRFVVESSSPVGSVFPCEWTSVMSASNRAAVAKTPREQPVAPTRLAYRLHSRPPLDDVAILLLVESHLNRHLLWPKPTLRPSTWELPGYTSDLFTVNAALPA